MKIIILNLLAFAQMGGVEKVSRILAKAGCDIAAETGSAILNLSLYDVAADSRYCPANYYKGFQKNKIKFVIEALKQGRTATHIILTHINLALPAVLIKLINPSVKIYLIAHGIEIWNPLSALQKRLLYISHKILAVSTFTRQKIAAAYPATANKISVINNCLDPFYIPADSFEKPQYLLDRYRILPDEKVLLTLCRLSSSEKYKGYDTVIESLNHLKQDLKLKYILLGKYDDAEYNRVQSIIQKEGLQDQVILAGFIPDKELTDHFLLGDLFIMPSIKEGFGIVFIEAAASGLPLIAGNKDGSTDALLNGRLGALVDPFSKEQLEQAIRNILNSPPTSKTQQHLAMTHFNYTIYKNKLKETLLN